MRVPSLILFLAASILCGLVSTSCSDKTKFRALCASDQECQDRHGNPNWACDKQVGDCVCSGDGACQEREHCELRPGGDGRCHPNRGCDWNEDCDGTMWCDTVNHICRVSGCDVDTNCRQGQICDQTSKTCIPGCRTHGDCATFGDVCLCMDDQQNPVPCVCDETTEAGRVGCTPGVCTSNTCTDNSFCKWGEYCDDPKPGEMLKQCRKDERGPFCGTCELDAGGGPRCKNPNGSTSNGNYCLEDTMTGNGQFCGVDCVDGQSCPNGFSCRDVRVVTGQACTSTEACQPHPASDSCTPETVAVDCPAGSRCVNGKCASTCLLNESGVRGYCGCVIDDECAKDVCKDGVCEISGRRCIDGCNDVRCINDGEIGYCWIGRNCAPDLGIPCADVREGKGPYDH